MAKEYLLDPARLPESKKCPSCGETKPAQEYGLLRRTNRSGSVSVVLAPCCKPCGRQKNRERMRLVPSEKKAAAAAKRRARDPRPRVVDRWYTARKRGCGDLTLEEYADNYERHLMGCKLSDWDAWMPARPSEPTAYQLRMDALRAKADQLQRPVTDTETGKKMWPSDWGAAMRYAWRYEHDRKFRRRERERTRLKKYMNPSYGASGVGHNHSPARWLSAQKQMGKVTRAHLRREMRARLCSYCLGEIDPKDRHLDHVVPLCRGGKHADTNIVAACGPCNRAKGRRTPLEWIMVRCSGVLPGAPPPVRVMERPTFEDIWPHRVAMKLCGASWRRGPYRTA